MRRSTLPASWPGGTAVLWLAGTLALWLAATSCKGSAGNGPTSRATACDEARDHVEALYRQHLAAPSPADDAARARLDDEQIADDVDMVLTDCRSDPARFAPCLRAAVSAPQMERDCLVRLDDEGTVEGQAFGRARDSR